MGSYIYYLRAATYRLLVVFYTEIGIVPSVQLRQGGHFPVRHSRKYTWFSTPRSLGGRWARGLFQTRTEYFGGRAWLTGSYTLVVSKR